MFVGETHTGFSYSNACTASMPSGMTTGTGRYVFVETVWHSGSCTISASTGDVALGMTQLDTTQRGGTTVTWWMAPYSASLNFAFTSTASDYCCAQVLGYSGLTGTLSFATKRSFSGSASTSPQTFSFAGGTATAGDDLIVMFTIDSGNSDQWVYAAGSGPAALTNLPGSYAQNAQNGAQYKDAFSGTTTGSISIVATTVAGTPSYISCDYAGLFIAAQVVGGGGPAATPVAAGATETQTGTVKRVINKVLTASHSQLTSSSPAVANALSLAATQTQTMTRARALGMVRTAQHTQSPTRLRAVTVAAKTATNSQAGSRLGSIGPLPKTATETQAGAATSTKTKLFAVTTTQSPSMIRGVTVARSANQTQTVTRSRALSLVRSATETQTPTVAKGFAKALAATQTQTPTRSRALALVRSATHTATITLRRAISLARAVTNSATGNATSDVSGGGGPANKTLTAQQTQTATVSRVVNLLRSVVTVQTPMRARTVNPAPKTATQTQSGSSVASRTFFKTLAATVTQSAVIGRALGLVRSVTSSQTVSRLRALTRKLTGNVTQAPSQAHTGGPSGSTSKTLAATQTQSPSVSVQPIRLGTVGGHAVCRVLAHSARISFETMSSSLGDTQRRILVSFADFDDEPADPDSASVTVGALGTFALARLRKGVWFYDLAPPAPAAGTTVRHALKAQGVGAIVAACEGVLEVRGYQQ